MRYRVDQKETCCRGALRGLLALLVLALWARAVGTQQLPPSPPLRVHFIDVGQERTSSSKCNIATAFDTSPQHFHPLDRKPRHELESWQSLQAVAWHYGLGDPVPL